MDFEKSISKQSVATVKKGLLASDLVGKTIVLDINSGCYFGLHTIASNIWNLPETPRSDQAIQNSLIAGHPIAPEQCERDTLTLWKELQGEGLVEVKDEAVV
ncbi:MAG: PqqD family peptide modification chaperone [Cyanobacteria bacterium J06639_16]